MYNDAWGIEMWELTLIDTYYVNALWLDVEYIDLKSSIQLVLHWDWTDPIVMDCSYFDAIFMGPQY